MPTYLWNLLPVVNVNHNVVSGVYFHTEGRSLERVQSRWTVNVSFSKYAWSSHNLTDLARNNAGQKFTIFILHNISIHVLLFPIPHHEIYEPVVSTNVVSTKMYNLY